MGDVRLGIGYIEYGLHADSTGAVRRGRDGAHAKLQIQGLSAGTMPWIDHGAQETLGSQPFS